MRAIETLMKRLGLVKLSDYGLVLTPEGRVMSMRPVVLDDGFGGKIVGWQDSDLATAELEPWPAPCAPMPRPAAVAAPPMPSLPGPATIAASAAPPVAPPASTVTPVVPPAPAPVVAAPPEEDDWEWTIAMARARAAADETEHALVPPPPAPARTVRSTMQPAAAASTEKPTARMSAVRASAPRMARGTPAPFPAAASTTSPATVIPVPSLPSVNRASAAQLAPVVRSPKVTRNAVPRTDFEDTVVSMPPAPPSEDTVPRIALPATRGPLPSVKRLGRA